MVLVGRLGITCVLVATASIASADDLKQAAPPDTALTMAPVERMWPQLPEDHTLSLEDQITDHLTELGNFIGTNMNALSDNMFALRVDGRRNRARLRVGGGNVHYLHFKIDSDVHFADGMAHVKTNLELGLHDHTFKLVLPAMDVIPDSYQGQRLVQINVPLLERHF